MSPERKTLSFFMRWRKLLYFFFSESDNPFSRSVFWKDKSNGNLLIFKMSKLPFDLSFQKTDLEKGLSDSEKKKYNNFLQRMKKLNVLRSGDIQGEYIFNSRLVRLYIVLNSIIKDVP